MHRNETGAMQKILLKRKWEAFHDCKRATGFIEIP
jgi:hypothetical protein